MVPFLTGAPLLHLYQVTLSVHEGDTPLPSRGLIGITCNVLFAHLQLKTIGITLTFDILFILSKQLMISTMNGTTNISMTIPRSSRRILRIGLTGF